MVPKSSQDIGNLSVNANNSGGVPLEYRAALENKIYVLLVGSLSDKDVSQSHQSEVLIKIKLESCSVLNLKIVTCSIFC